ncbi:LysR family transcriptional regulator [Parapusillimonas granuli]|uniref:LysR family transcriptional regulator n=1 Tax=Parapusillimonas granuli TaxID=380911 RepID=A0A853G3Q2_9BURK|nr:LysR family transcriptional regulator [Parapusillimonas granuli]MBB5215042.1 DNA-binding transcriptional LysR family regulator [Parapusillimonas granuli]MEB2401712.1 LysR family transcriptional regulator [Alcaligenaceae bacterium]NYT49361.1 LysR family transcriptional regulator [Parapusillimonas granuli]
MNITLRQLEAFSHIERFGSFVRAAREMCLTQSALSHLARELEQNLGFPLFRRTTRSVRLTREGEAFLPYARRILTNLDSAVECARALSAGEEGVLRVATTPLLASTHLMSAVARYQEVNPGVHIHVQEAIASETIQLLADEKVDLAIGPQRSMPKEVVSETLFTSRLALLRAKTHYTAGRPSVKWRELEGEQLVLAKGGGKETIGADIKHMISLDAAREVEHFTTLMALASSGKCVAIANDYIEPFLAVYNLEMAHLVQPVVRRKIALYTSRSQSLARGAGKFMDFLRSALRPGAPAANAPPAGN